MTWFVFNLIPVWPRSHWLSLQFWKFLLGGDPKKLIMVLTLLFAKEECCYMALLNVLLLFTRNKFCFELLKILCSSYNNDLKKKPSEKFLSKSYDHHMVFLHLPFVQLYTLPPQRETPCADHVYWFGSKIKF